VLYIMNKKFMLAVALFLNSFFSCAFLQITVPLLSTMVAAQGFTNQSLIGLIVTLPCLTIIPTVLLCGKLSETMSKKTLFYIGTIIFLIGGLGAIFTTSITGLLICRAILGLGSGFCILLVTGFIPDYYEGPALTNMMGIVLAGVGVMGFLQANLAGLLGTISWQTAYWVHALALIPMLGVLFFVPSKPTVTVTQNAPGEKSPLPPVIFLYFLITVFLYMTIMVLWSQVSVFIANEHLGNVAYAGLAASLVSAFSFVGSIFFGKLFGFLKRYATHATIVFAAIGYLIVANANSFAMVLIGIAIYGFAVGLFSPLFLTIAVMRAPKSQAVAQAIILVGVLVGQFISAFWLQMLSSFGNGSLRSSFLLNSIILVIALAIGLVGALITGRKKPSAEQSV